MNSAEILRMALLNLKRRKVRTFLAVMGVIIGTCAIVVMLSLGIGLSQSYTEQIKNMGNIHMITIYSGGGGFYEGMSSPSPKDKDKGKITDKTLAKIKKTKGVTAVTPVDRYHGRILIGKYSMDTSVVGVDPAAMDIIFNNRIEEGRNFTASDKEGFIFGGEIKNWFWDEQSGYPPPRDKDGNLLLNVISDKIIFTRDETYNRKKGGRGGMMMEESAGERPKYELHKVKGIGTLKQSDDEFAYRVFTTLDAVKKLRESDRRAEKAVGQRGGYERDIKKDGYEQAMIYVEDINEVEKIIKDLKEEGFMVESLMDILNEVKKTAGIIQAVLGGIGAISLIVAALGITNTMIMSIYERTREIGVMKVLGAGLRDIRNLFLIEAGLIGFFGGVVGNILSLLISWGINTLLAGVGGEGGVSEIIGMGMMGDQAVKLSAIPFWLLAASMLFAVGIGVLSGYYPAKRAMRLSALESLRNE